MEKQILNDLLIKIKKYNATDVHICVGAKPLMRVGTKLQEVPDSQKILPPDIENIVENSLNDSMKEILKEQKTLDFSYSISGVGRFRLNIYLQRGTYAIAIRMLPLMIPKLSDIGLPDKVSEFADLTSGLVLFTGSSGCGKSTTLASLINQINENHRYHIITIEDPLEYLHSHKKSLVTQKEIGEDALSFSGALRSALRQDPDVIMIGEMRDVQTISIALSAAETGHLVLSTLHTIGAVKSIDRILDSFPNSQHSQIRSQLATVLRAVVSQQLIPDKEYNELQPVCEILSVTPAVQNLIREDKHYQIKNIIQTGKQDGMYSMERQLADLASKGIVDTHIARLKALDQKLFDQYLSIAR